ncbi:MAG: ABC transporter permease [Bacteriovoracaceae bacterium]|nr:ABC transporter permease [Bacteriovoracaceae bacterium]
MKDTFNILVAIIKRKTQQQFGIKILMAYFLMSAVFDLVIYFFTNQLVDQSNFSNMASGTNYFSFVVIGAIFSDFFATSTQSASSVLAHERASGTLESYLQSPYKLFTLLYISSLAEIMNSIIRTLFYLIIALFLGFNLQLSWQLVWVFLYIVIAILTFQNISIIFSALTLIDRRLNHVCGNIVTISIVLSGAFYPLTVVPEKIRFLFLYLPFTVTITWLRELISGSQNTFGILLSIVLLFVFTNVFARWVFYLCEGRSMKNGNILFH